MLKVFYFMSSCCTNLQIHVRNEIEFMCSKGEIDDSSRTIGMKMDTFVYLFFISMWINLPRHKIMCKYIIVQYIKSISQNVQMVSSISTISSKVYYQKGSCFLTIIVLPCSSKCRSSSENSHIFAMNGPILTLLVSIHSVFNPFTPDGQYLT